MFTLSLLLAFFLMVCFKLTHNKTDGGGSVLWFNTYNQHQSQNTKQFHHPPKCPSYWPSVVTPSQTLIPATNQSVLYHCFFFLRMSPKWNQCVASWDWLPSLSIHWMDAPVYLSHLHCFNANGHIRLTAKGLQPLPGAGQVQSRIPCTSFLELQAKRGGFTELAGSCRNPS